MLKLNKDEKNLLNENVLNFKLSGVSETGINYSVVVFSWPHRITKLKLSYINVDF